MSFKIKLTNGTVHEFFDAGIDLTPTEVRVTQHVNGVRQAVFQVDRDDLKKITIKP